ncbi:hypothetical protein [Methylococcus sp. EFPC2]|uniref:hypothetical protein n=1 Tax=Methylococcus sp. EFPC2 TaxID=2812648 RepID=UPI0019689796|nr:hypothetical protein [Methylococcus sp. EFPC2]QSA98563.1 hypothetical protein JWZ97_07135 [Methylococcus sp. EFPC2]
MSVTHTRNFLAVAILASAAGGAWALPPSTPDLTLYIPGSQANDPNYANLCTGSIDYYFHTTSTPSAANNNNYSAIYCETNSTKVSGLPAGTKKLWISRRRLGASFVGLDAVTNGTQLTYLKDPATAVCTAFAGDFVSAGVHYPYQYACTTVTGGITATAATSDATPDVFHGSDNVTPGLNDINTSGLTVRALAGHIIGIPVTLKLRNALQYAESLNGLIPADCVPGDDVRADCVPSLSKQQLTSLFAGQVVDWTSIHVDVSASLPGGIPGGGGTTTTPNLAELVAYGAASHPSALSNPLDTTVHICRRENGAGQQVAVLANILQYPCLGSAAPSIAVPGGLNDVGYATSLGAVDNCLSDYNDGSNKWFGTSNAATAGGYPDPPATGVPHGNQWAIGIQTTERNATRGANYRFIKIDGALPTVEQSYLGHYPLVSEYAISWKNPGSGSTGGYKLQLLNALVNVSKTPATVSARNNANSNHYFGQAGYIALSANGYAPSETWDPTNPVTPYTHAASGTPNACSIPVVNPDFGTVELR